MREITIKAYTLSELAEQFPDAYLKVCERWKEFAGEDIPWAGEARKSVEAVVSACDSHMQNWNIAAYDRSDITVTGNIPDEDGCINIEDIKGREAMDWVFEHVLRPAGYTRDDKGNVEFPGLCPFTGYCMDEECCESVWKDLQAGNDLKTALEGLAVVWRKHLEDSLEQMQSEESMLANWGESEFTANGEQVKDV